MDASYLSHVIADNIKLFMAQAGIESQSELARQSGVAQTTIGLYLSPERRPGQPNLKYLMQIAETLRVEVWELLKPGTEEEHRMLKEFSELLRSAKQKDAK